MTTAPREVVLVERAARAPAWIPLATAAVAAALLGTTVDGSQATAVPGTPAPALPGDVAADATAAGSAAAGTLLLVLRDNGAAFTQAVTGLAPGDSASRYVDVVETGTLDGRRLTVAADAAGPLVAALSVTVDGCRGGAWQPATGVCTGTVAPLLTGTPLGTLTTPTVLDPLGPARRLPLRVTLTMADREERAVNGVLPAQTVQGTEARLRWTFSVVQA